MGESLRRSFPKKPLEDPVENDKSLLFPIVPHLLLGEHSNLLRKMCLHLFLGFTNLGSLLRGELQSLNIRESQETNRYLYFCLEQGDACFLASRFFSVPMLCWMLVLGASWLKQEQILGFSLTLGRTSEWGMFTASACGHVGSSTSCLQCSACEPLVPAFCFLGLQSLESSTECTRVGSAGGDWKEILRKVAESYVLPWGGHCEDSESSEEKKETDWNSDLWYFQESDSH